MATEGVKPETLEKAMNSGDRGQFVAGTVRGKEITAFVQFTRDSGRVRGIALRLSGQGRGRGLPKPEQPT